MDSLKRMVTLIILVDALRHDYINEVDAPFLFSLEKKGLSGKLREPFTFQTRPAFFAGLYPESSDVGHLFWFDPEDSPFYFTKDLAPPAQDPTKERSNSLFQEFLAKEAKRIEKSKGHSASAAYADPCEIPYNFLHYFAFSEKIEIFDPHALPHPSLFDILRAPNLTWLWIAYPIADLHTKAVIKAFKEQINPTYDLVFLHLSELDWTGHDYGPNSEERKKALKEIDLAISEIIGFLEIMFQTVRWVIFGDHGMVEIKETLDLETLLSNNLPWKAPEDYIYFLDSTQARFWFKKEGARKDIQKFLSKLSEMGKVLGEKDYGELRIRFPHRKFGELFFVLHEGRVMYPDFFRRTSPPKGMHGYLPDVRDNWAAFLVFNDEMGGRRIEYPIELVDLFPTILTLLELPIPASSEGTSILPAHDSEKIRGKERKMEKHKAFISVIIPSFNRRDILKRTLEAYFNQTYPKELYELIVVDDGSTDGTDQMVTSMLKNGPPCRLRFFKHQTNKGLPAARNLGTREAFGDLILHVNDDCIPISQFLEEHMKFYFSIAQPNIGVLGQIDLHPDIKSTHFLDFIYRGPQFVCTKLIHGTVLNFWDFYGGNVLLEKKKLLEIGLFDEDFKSSLYDDTELSYRLHKTGFKLIYNENAVTYHYHETNLQNFQERQRKVGETAILFYKKHPELREWLNINTLADPNFRDQYYHTVLTYASLVGMENALRNGLRKGDEDIIPLMDELKEGKSRYQTYLEIELEKTKQKCIEFERNTKAIENQIVVLSNELSNLSNELSTLKSSMSYKLTRPIIAKIYQIFPDGTRLGELRKVIVANLNILLTQGFKSCLKHFKEKIKGRKFKMA